MTASLGLELSEVSIIVSIVSASIALISIILYFRYTKPQARLAIKQIERLRKSELEHQYHILNEACFKPLSAMRVRERDVVADDNSEPNKLSFCSSEPVITEIERG